MYKKLYQSALHFFTKFSKIIKNSWNDFWSDDCYTKASALAYYTLQSIVPLFAFIFGIAKGFAFDKYLKDLIIKTFEGQKAVAEYLIRVSENALHFAEGGIIVGIGLIFLIWGSVNLLGSMEFAFNQIWKTKKHRPFFQKIYDYTAILIICPVIFILSSSLTIYFKGKLTEAQQYELLKTISTALLWVLKISPWMLISLLFFLIYLLVPYTKIRILPKVIAAIIAGCAFQLWQIVYIDFLINMFNYDVIYGSFAFVPLFFIWLQISWLIVLYGAEISYSIENFLPEDFGIHEKVKMNQKQISLLIIYACIQKFDQLKPAPTSKEMAKDLKIPLEIVEEKLKILSDQNILIPTERKDDLIGYRPYGSLSQMTIKDVFDAIVSPYETEVTLPSNEITKKIIQLSDKIDDSFKNSNANLTLDQFLKN